MIPTIIFAEEARPPHELDFANDVLDAIANVQADYCRWSVNHESEGNIDKVQQLERVFAYEFYHQLKLIALNSLERYRGIRIDGEIGKISNGIKYPDLVIHGGQTDRSNQKIIIEIKSLRNSIDISDINKLYKYIDHLNFEYGIFVCVCNDVSKYEDLYDKIRRELRNVDLQGSTANKILVVVYDGFDRYITTIKRIFVSGDRFWIVKKGIN
jgi:hypothetical protein